MAAKTDYARGIVVSSGCRRDAMVPILHAKS